MLSDTLPCVAKEYVRISGHYGLAEDELALFDLLLKDGLDQAARERVKQASKELLAAVKARLAELDRFWENEQTKADVEVFILDEVFASLPTPPFTPAEKKLVAANVYAHVWQQAINGTFVTVSRSHALFVRRQIVYSALLSAQAMGTRSVKNTWGRHAS